MKNFKRIIALVLVFCFLIMTFSSVAVFAEETPAEEVLNNTTTETVEEPADEPSLLVSQGTGWVEISVTVPQYFTDQIYVQLQNVNNIVEDSEENYVQINRYNDYIGRIELPSGSYEITDMYAYEHPDKYNIEIAKETALPVRVTGSSTATSVMLTCTEIVEEAEPEQPSANSETLISSSQSEGGTDGEKPADSADSVLSDEDEGAEEKAPKSALRRLIESFVKNLIWFGVLSGIGYVLYRKFYLNN